MRLIDADALEAKLQRVGGSQIIDTVINLIKRQPTIDAEPVRHGRWIGHVGYIPTANGDMEIKVCSCCQEEIAIYDFDYYCPYCGAKMDGGAEDVV